MYSIKSIFKIITNNKSYIFKKSSKYIAIFFSVSELFSQVISIDIVVTYFISCIDIEDSPLNKLVVTGAFLVVIWLCGLLAAICRILKCQEIELFDTGNGHKVYVRYGDIFKLEDLKAKYKKLNVVISVNRCFDTIVDDNLITRTTLHGQLFTKFYDNNIYEQKELTDLIKNQLSGNDYKYETLERKNKKKGNLKRYLSGTVVEISDKNNVNYFLLALSSIDLDLHSHINNEEYSEALVKLLNYCHKRSQGYPVILPIIAAGAANFYKTEQVLLEYIVKSIKLNLELVNCDMYIIVRNSARETVSITNL